jgi:uncharacterized membrane protein YkoI
MAAAQRIAFAALLALAAASVSVRAEEPTQATQAGAAGHPVRPEAEHACLDQKERRAEVESGKLIRLSTAMRAAKSRMQGTVVRARLCHGPDGLVYVLTVLARDGKVARITVDAVKGTFVGGL